MGTNLSRWSIAALALSTTLLLSPLLGACDAIDNNNELVELMPLSVGNYWDYSSTWLGGAITDSFRVEITRRIPVRFEGKGFTSFAESVRFPGEPVADTDLAWLYANGRDGRYSMGGVVANDTFVLRSLNRKYPAGIGDTWRAVRLGYRPSSTPAFAVLDTVTVTLEATGEPLDTPAGTFKCYVYRYSFRPADDVVEMWDVLEYYAPGIGLVKEVILGQDDGRLLQETVLFEYRVQ